MICDQYREQFGALLDNELTALGKQALESHLADCTECRTELASMQKVWALMGTLKAPEPSSEMKAKFQSMLQDYKASTQETKGAWTRIGNWLSRVWEVQPRLPLAYPLAIAILGLGGGYFIFHNSNGAKQEQQLEALSGQMQELRQTMMLALLQNPSASQRIRGVSYTSEVGGADKKVIEALLETLDNDPNVNVRISALDALMSLANSADVREGMIRSIVRQDSPLMQSAIADAMLKLQEKRSVKPFQELLKQKDLDAGVRDKIKQTIIVLI